MAKWVNFLRLGSMICSVIFLFPGVVYAKKKEIGLQEVIAIALKDNLLIRMAENTRRTARLSNKVSIFKAWAPKARLMFPPHNKWGMEKENVCSRSGPLLTLTWTLDSIFRSVFHTKITYQENDLHNLTAAKAVEKELQQVVTCYYELALAQKQWELSNMLIKCAALRLKVEEEKFRLGLVTKIDYLNAELSLKEVKLSILEHQLSLKEKGRNFNFRLGKPLDEEIMVKSAISIQPIWDITAVTKEKVVGLATAIQAQKVAIARTKLIQVKSYLLSCLNLSAGLCSDSYIYNVRNSVWNTTNTANQSLYVSVSLDLGELLLLPAEIKKANIALSNEKLLLTKEKLAADGNLEDKKWQYRQAINLHKIAAEKLKINKEKLALAKAQYRLNQIKLLDFHEAEQAVQKAEMSLINYAFKVKQAEFDLYRLIGMFYK